MYNFVTRALCTALVLTLTACGGGSGGTTNNSPVITQGAATSVNMSVNNTPTAFSLTLDASDADGDTLTWSISSAATHGTASASGTGTSKAVNYSPNADYVGTDSFIVQVSDGQGGTDSITVNVTVSNAAPVITEGAATSVSMSVNGTPTAFSLTLHASDVNSDTLTWSVSSAASNGTASASGTGTNKVIGYTPTKDYAGMDNFVVQVSDGHGGINTITVNVTVNNDAPPVISQSKPASVSMSVNSTPTAFNLTLDASDANGETLTWSISSPATHGTASASGTGTSKVVGYTPATDYAGPDSFVVQVSDGSGGTDTITVNVTVNNDASPVIAEGASTNVIMSENSTPTAFSLALNATDTNGETLTWSISSPATHGTASASGTGTSKVVGYDPTTDYVGTDSFDVQVSDGHGGTDTITVNVVVNAIPVITQGASTNVSMSENSTPTAFSLTLHASDANSDTLTWSISTAAAHGTASASGTGTSKVVGYTPDTDYIGNDSFVVQVDDGHGGIDTTTVNVTITTTNTVAISVDAGVYPSDINYFTYNRPFVSVTICEPSSPTTCQTIDHIVVDTGSTGLRILSSAVSLSLPAYSVNNKSVGECYPLVGGYLWGALRTATVQMGGEITTSPIPIQVINDNAVATAPSACTGVGSNLGSVSAIKANGILGVGYFKQDCGTACESAANKVYFTCTTTDPTTCTSPGTLAADQVPNPVTLFGLNGSGVSDNNGVIISLPAIDAAGATSVSGTLTFGVNTQDNNQLGSATVLTVDNPTGLLPTEFNGKTLCNSAIDSGSNNLNFPEGTMTGGNDFDTPTLCGDNTFYCPASTQPFSATIYGVNGAYAPVNFDVANTDGLSINFHAFNNVAAKLDTLAATTIPDCPSGGTAGSFIWGLPFFFGKNVFTVFEDETVDSSTGPFTAF